MTAARGCVLEGARIVHHDRIESRSLEMVQGRVGGPSSESLRVDLTGHLIFPGLINAHDHLQLNNVPPFDHTRKFPNSYAWIEAFESHFTDPAVVASLRVPSASRHWHGAMKNLLAGVTTVAHHDPLHPVLDDPDFPVAVVRDCGWCHSLRFGAPQENRPPKYGPAVQASFAATPSTEPWIIHLAEGIDDVAAAELAQLDALGCLAANTVLVHGVGLSATDQSRIIEARASVVWCPSSNLATLGRTLDPRRFTDCRPEQSERPAPTHLALGTDSRLSGSRDLLDELRVAAAQSSLSASELLMLVTENARRVLRLADRGALADGFRADCVIARDDGDPYDALLRLRRSDIRAVVREGAPVVADLDFAGWFLACGVETSSVQLDEAPKLIATRLLRNDVIRLESGLTRG